MDSFDVGALSSEPLVVFCVATAGKGSTAARHTQCMWSLRVGMVGYHVRAFSILFQIEDLLDTLSLATCVLR
jgi:hypothetical protein